MILETPKSRVGSPRATATRFPTRAFVLLPLSVTAYSLVLHFVYLNFIYEPFKYTGFRYESPDTAVTLVALLAAIGACITLPKTLTRPSATMLWVLFVVVISPFILMSPYLDISSDGETCIRAIAISAAFAAVCLSSRRRRADRGFAANVQPALFWSIIIGFSVIVYVYMAIVTGVSLRLVAVRDVYDVRADYSDAISDSKFLGYLVSTQANAINPIVIAAGIYSRRALPLAAGVGGQFLLYSSTGFKTILFSLAAITIIAVLFRISSRPRALILVWGAIGVLATASIADQLQNGVIWSSLLTRRFLVTPARLTAIYLDFYDTHPFHLLGNSSLAPWVTSPYQYGPARNISLYTTGTPDIAMNANLFADGFAQFGWFGVAIMSALLVVYLRVLDRAATGLPSAVTSLVVVMPAVTLSNTSLQTSLLSHGLLAALLVILIAPRNIWGRRYGGRRGQPIRVAGSTHSATRA